MNLFDNLVTEALKSQHSFSQVRMVVEKELLHHDILRIMSDQGLLKNLTFIGGTCLRVCYDGMRLSEDLDFTGGSNFSRDNLSHMGKTLMTNLSEKYGLVVQVSEPVKDISNVDTWKIRIETRPQQKHMPSQRINIDICAVPSYEKQPRMIINHYGVEMGTSGLIVQAQSREEIFADKLLAFALRPNRIKYRDLWDISWLNGLGVKPRLALIPNKLRDRECSFKVFLDHFSERQKSLKSNPKMEKEFQQEMERFLPFEELHKNPEQSQLWSFLIYLIEDFGVQLHG